MTTPILFADGFDQYGPTGSVDFSSTNTAGIWTTVTGGSLVAPITLATGSAMRVGGGGSLVSSTFTAVSRIAGSIRLRTNTAATTAAVTVRNGATAAFTIDVSEANGIRLRTGGTGGSVISTGGSYVSSTAVVVSFDITIGASASYSVSMDGSVWLTGTGNTGNGQASVNTVVISSASSDSDFDDLVLFDPAQAGYDSGCLTNNVVVETQFPNGDSQTQFTNDGDLVIADGVAQTGIVRLTGTTNAPGAGQLYVLKIVPNISRTINSVSMIPSATSAGAKFKAVIYSDSSGAPNALLSDGNEVVGAVSGTTLTSSLVTPQSLTAGTAYWIGFYTDTSVTVRKYDNTTALGQKKANTYGSGAPATLSGMTTGQATWLIWGNCTGSAVNWVAISRNPPPGIATDQVHSSTVSQEDLFTFPALSLTADAIYTGVVLGFVSKSDAGARTVSFNMKSSSSDSTGSSSSQALLTTKRWQVSFYENDPATSAAWLQSAADSAVSGYSVAS